MLELSSKSYIIFKARVVNMLILDNMLQVEME